MDLGLHYGVYPEIGSDGEFAETRGFTHAWLYDSQMLYGDVYAGLCVLACRTRKMKLGPGVTNPRSRIFPTTASGIATVNLFAPGRAILGIGTGNSTRRAMGFPAVRLAELRECVEVCRGLLRGESVMYREADQGRRIKFLNPQNTLNIKDPIPIYISAAGPKALELAGEIADGIILWGVSDERLVRYHLDHVARGAARAGRNMKELYVACLTACHFTQPGESIESIRNAVGYMAVSGLNLVALSCRNEPDALPTEFRDDIMATVRAFRKPGESVESRHLDPYEEYGTSLSPLHQSLATEKAMRATSIIGSPQECLETIRKIERAGVHQVAVAMAGKNRHVFLDTFARNIIERY